MTWKAAVSKPGFNVLTETDPNNLIFSSDYNTFKYQISGTITVNYVINQLGIFNYSNSFSFNFGYKPIILVYVDRTTTGSYVPLPYHSEGLPFVEDFHCYWDNNTLNFEVTEGNAFAGSVSTKTATFRYFIFLNNTGL